MEVVPEERWMQEAIAAAKRAETAGEVPIGAALVANDELVATGETAVGRRGPIAHGENSMLTELGSRVWSLNHPVVLYTTLEPCIMCLGAATNAGVDAIVFGSPAAPDGGTWVKSADSAGRLVHLTVVGGFMKAATDSLLMHYLDHSTNDAGREYVESLLQE